MWRSGGSDFSDDTIRVPQARAQFFWLRRARGVLWVIGGVIVVALLVGYIALAAFLAEHRAERREGKAVS